jgi:hypothetical protein
MTYIMSQQVKKVCKSIAQIHMYKFFLKLDFCSGKTLLNYNVCRTNGGHNKWRKTSIKHCLTSGMKHRTVWQKQSELPLYFHMYLMSHFGFTHQLKDLEKLAVWVEKPYHLSVQMCFMLTTLGLKGSLWKKMSRAHLYISKHMQILYLSIYFNSYLYLNSSLLHYFEYIINNAFTIQKANRKIMLV